MRCLRNVRIDERFIHGQVLIKWLEYLDCHRIVILDDNVSSNPIMSRVMKMSVPKSVSLNIFDFKRGVEYLKAITEEDSTIVLIRNLEALRELYTEGFILEKVNIARLPYYEGKELLCENIYIDLEEKRIIKKLMEAGVNLSIQMVPDSDAINLNTLLYKDI